MPVLTTTSRQRVPVPRSPPGRGSACPCPSPRRGSACRAGAYLHVEAACARADAHHQVEAACARADAHHQVEAACVRADAHHQVEAARAVPMLTTRSKQRVPCRCSPPGRGSACRAGAHHHVEAACALALARAGGRRHVEAVRPMPVLTTRSRRRVPCGRSSPRRGSAGHAHAHHQVEAVRAMPVLTTTSRQCVPLPVAIATSRQCVPCWCRAGSMPAAIAALRIHGHCVKKVRTLSTNHRIGRKAAPALALRVLSRTEYKIDSTEDTEYRFERAARQRTQAEKCPLFLVKRCAAVQASAFTEYRAKRCTPRSPSPPPSRPAACQPVISPYTTRKTNSATRPQASSLPQPMPSAGVVRSGGRDSLSL